MKTFTTHDVSEMELPMQEPAKDRNYDHLHAKYLVGLLMGEPPPGEGSEKKNYNGDIYESIFGGNPTLTANEWRSQT